jgi:hypothetical protein
MLEFKDIVNGEKCRTYIFSDGEFKIHNATRLAVSERGTHRVESADGRKFIVQPKWLAIEIDCAEWSF